MRFWRSVFSVSRLVFEALRPAFSSLRCWIRSVSARFTRSGAGLRGLRMDNGDGTEVESLRFEGGTICSLTVRRCFFGRIADAMLG